MIFSFPSEKRGEINFTMDQTDIFCFFHSEKHVLLPTENWLTFIGATLKMKRNVLLLEEPLLVPPTINFTQRWSQEANFLWLAPRSLSVLFEAPLSISSSYKSVKAHLITFK